MKKHSNILAVVFAAIIVTVLFLSLSFNEDDPIIVRSTAPQELDETMHITGSFHHLKLEE